MILKPRIATKVAVIIGGLMFSVGLPIGYELGGFLGIIPGIFGVLGVLWIIVAIWALAQRDKMSIRIDESGIEIPSDEDEGRVLLRREEIESISKHETLRGRQIEIVLRGGRQILLPIREYCELKDFISYCRDHGLST